MGVGEQLVEDPRLLQEPLDLRLEPARHVHGVDHLAQLILLSRDPVDQLDDHAVEGLLQVVEPDHVRFAFPLGALLEEPYRQHRHVRSSLRPSSRLDIFQGDRQGVAEHRPQVLVVVLAQHVVQEDLAVRGERALVALALRDGDHVPSFEAQGLPDRGRRFHEEGMENVSTFARCHAQHPVGQPIRPWLGSPLGCAELTATGVARHDGV